MSLWNFREYIEKQIPLWIMLIPIFIVLLIIIINGIKMIFNKWGCEVLDERKDKKK